MSSINVFDNWGDYKMTLLFNWWETKTVSNFVLSCVGIFGLAFIVQMFVWLSEVIKHKIYKINVNSLSVELSEDSVKLLEKKIYFTTPFWWEILYFFVSFAYYSLYGFMFLLLGTYNPWIFISIMLGYSIGGVIVNNRLIKMEIERVRI